MALPPYQQPDPRIAFWALFGLFAVGEYAMQARSRIRRRGVRVERWSLLVVFGTVIGGLVAGVRLAQWRPAEIGSGQWPLFILGLVLMAAGIAVRQWAILTLGRYFTADVRVHQDQAVVDRGPYRWVRHPSYTGLITFFLGLGLALDSWASLAVLAVLPTTGLIVRIHAEERALLSALGEPYRRFSAGRRRLLPGVW